MSTLLSIAAIYATWALLFILGWKVGFSGYSKTVKLVVGSLVIVIIIGVAVWLMVARPEFWAGHFLLKIGASLVYAALCFWILSIDDRKRY